MINSDNSMNEAVYKEMLKNLDLPEIYNLCQQISEKFLDKDNDMYKYFHDDSNIKENNDGSESS